MGEVNQSLGYSIGCVMPGCEFRTTLSASAKDAAKAMRNHVASIHPEFLKDFDKGMKEEPGA